MTYLIEATIVKDGGEPVHWKRYSNTKPTKKQVRTSRKVFNQLNDLAKKACEYE